MLRNRSAFLLLASTLQLVILLFAPLADAQYIQRWRWETVNGVEVPTWRPQLGDASEPVVMLAANEAVYLEYNCFYLRAICQNARQYLISALNKERQWRTAFTYDLNSGRGDKGRRTRVCKWKKADVLRNCPERAAPGNLPQPPVVRNHDTSFLAGGVAGVNDPRPPGTLPSVEFEAGTRKIQGYTDAVTGQYMPSGLTYSCDEFPAAKWVEGGVGVQPPEAAPPEGRGEVAYTRCAPQRHNGCGAKGFNSEQDWQGWSHGRLRGVVAAAARDYLHGNLDEDRAAVVFFFRMTSLDNGVAVRIVHQKTDGTEAVAPQLPTRGESSSSSSSSARSKLDWADKLVLDYEDPNAEVHELLVQPEAAEITRRSAMFSDPLAMDGMGANATDASDLEMEGMWRVRKRQSTYSAPNIAKREEPSPAHVSRFDTPHNVTVAPLLGNATLASIAQARKLVAQAISDMTTYNKERLENPQRNRYSLRPGTSPRPAPMSRLSQADQGSPSLMHVGADVAAAAALLAEYEAAGEPKFTNQTVIERTSARPRKRGSFWMEHISRKGSVPWGNDPSYKVFRNVRDYGARGDGVTDDTNAIRRAMFEGKRCGEKCNGSTTKNAIVYFPPGTYLVSGTIQVIFGTQLIGDANDWPVIKAAPSFVGLGVLSTDEYVPDGGTGADGKAKQWYINTANFYRQIRNFKIDIRAADPGAYVCGIHYQIAQATSLQFVEIIADSGTTQQGIFAENGSGGVLADITFRGGNFGLYGGNQQFTAQRLKFIGCNTAVQMIWDWGWIWKSISVSDSRVGFRLTSETGSSGYIGSSSFLDSTFSNVGTAIIVKPPSSKTGDGTTGLVLENVQYDRVGVGVADTDGRTLQEGGSRRVASWVVGPVYAGERTFLSGQDTTPYKREATLLDVAQVAGAQYFERPKPQYQGVGSGDFVHLKDMGAKGDGVTDDTDAFQRALDGSVGKILFIDAGTYILTRTVTVPVGAKLVGETWSQLAARGSFFSDANNPKVMIKVGSEGDVGNIEMQDLLFTTQGPTAGAILVQWNIKAASQGSAGLWDCHARIGGAVGTKLNSAECPPITNGVNANCHSASMIMHITEKASGYFENMWLWVADHDIDDPKLDDADNDMAQLSTYVARGLLVESQAATWLYGTSSEHCVYYQYNFHNARNIFAGMIQTESPYYQPNPKPPVPFEKQVGVVKGDPSYKCGGGDFDGCDSSWAVLITGSRNIFIAGAGLYSWFDNYSQDCIDSQRCQKALLFLQNNSGNIRVQHLITIGAKYSVVADGVGMAAADNLAVTIHPRWSHISLFDSDTTGGGSEHKSPKMATVIPMPHSTVPAGQTFTFGTAAVPDVTRLPFDGRQNDAPGPGPDVCRECSFFRLLTSTCCGVEGSVGNPIVIAPNFPLPLDVPLPASFVPPLPFISGDGESIPAGRPLTQETVIPWGTIFDRPFVIPPGLPLREGEDVDESVVWVSPDIWNQEHPRVACRPPCTLMLPPWRKATVTIDYPRITVTEKGTLRTLTYPPITKSVWGIEPVIIPGRGVGSKTTTTTTDIIAIITPTVSTTSTWDTVRWTDEKGTTHTTRPTSPPRPPPPSSTPTPPGESSDPHSTYSWTSPPVLTIEEGKPTPTTGKCAFPAPGCPTSTVIEGGGGGGGADDPSEPDKERDEDEDDEEECSIDLPSKPTSDPDPKPSPSPSPPPSPSPSPKAKPNPSENKKQCYNSGAWVTRANAVPVVAALCRRIVSRSPITGPILDERWLSADYSIIQGWGWVSLLMGIEVYDNCEWSPTQDECERYYHVLLDSCDCGGVNYKKGGVLTNNCIRLRMDPTNLLDTDWKKEFGWREW